MRQSYVKFIFIGGLISAALLARAGYSSVAQMADATDVTAGSSGAEATAWSAPAASAGRGAVAADYGPGPAVGTSAFPAGSSQSVSLGGEGVALPFMRVGEAPPPELDYHEALVADLASGAILWGAADGTRWPLASVTKLMTAAVASDTLNPAQRIAITPEMLAHDPSDQMLAVGDTYAVSDLLRILLLKSSNVAAEALAGVAGRAQFLAAMNARAAALGMADTYYYDPSGLSSSNQSTADDLLRLAQAVYSRYPDILALTRLPQATVTNLATGRKLIVKSINNFAGQPDFLGGKTGYTDVADGNLLSVFKHENRPVLIVILGTDDARRFDNTTALYNWFKANYK